MRLLLDTNVLIPLLEGRVVGRLRETLVAPETELYASVASLWEMAIKSRVGKLRLTVPLQQLPDVIAATGASLLSINPAHVLALPEPEPATRDPFDRLLLAQCMIEGLRFVTLDRALVSHPLSWQTA
jgi:PIN domain nuclease of toxin-antitoxin system